MDDSRTADLATTIHDSAERLAGLGERVRGIDRTLRGTDHGGQPTDVARVVEAVAARLRERRPEADVTVDCGGRLAAYADDLLATAVWNLAENAVEHHDGDLTVRFDARREDETVVLRVVDDGPGIPETERRPVESGHETQLEHTSGLGLWLVRWIVDGVDGDISFRTREPTGSVVRLHLRAAATTDLPSSPPPLDVCGEASRAGVGRIAGDVPEPDLGRYPAEDDD